MTMTTMTRKRKRMSLFKEMTAASATHVVEDVVISLYTVMTRGMDENEIADSEEVSKFVKRWYGDDEVVA